VRDVLRTVERVHGAPLRIREAPRRAGDPPMLVAHASRVRQALNWSPRYDDLETIVRTQLEWERRLIREPMLQRN
jgi:UDP-glucose 4-epimerase